MDTIGYMKNCSRCMQLKNEDEFAARNKAKGTLQPYCKVCRKEIDAKLWKTNSKFRLSKTERMNEYRLRNNEYVLEYLKTHPCVDCAENDPIVLDFDHLRDKIANVAKLVDNTSLSSLKEEIDKCEVRCSNCHRRKTARERNYFRFREMD